MGLGHLVPPGSGEAGSWWHANSGADVRRFPKQGLPEFQERMLVRTE